MNDDKLSFAKDKLPFEIAWKIVQLIASLPREEKQNLSEIKQRKILLVSIKYSISCNIQTPHRYTQKAISGPCEPYATIAKQAQKIID
jgi:hypothetical protein